MDSTRQQIAATFFEAQKQSIVNFVKTVVEQEGFLDDDWVKSQCQYSLLSITVAAHSILLATPACVLQGLISGDLPEMAQDPDLRYMQRAIYTAVPPMAREPDCVYPSIYAIYLVDTITSKPPTIADLRVIIPRVKQEIAIMAAVNSAAAATELVDELEDRIDGCVPTSTLEGGLVDIGFSQNSHERLRQHHNGASSNEVMQVFRDFAIAMFNNRYCLRGYIVCKLHQFNHCALAELY